MIKNLVKSLSLSSGERRGVIVLVSIISVIIGIQAFMNFHHTPSPAFNDSLFFRLITEEPAENDSDEFTDYEVPEIHGTFELFYFDPNTISATDLMRLGLSARVTRTWINYRLHGGRFYSANDIRKIYGMAPYTCERLIPYIRLQQEAGGAILTRNDTGFNEKMCINTCDSADLVRIRGIGTVLSARIIKYRRLLGGFYDMQQLSEVYGINDSLVKVISLSFYADTTNINTININEASEETLRKHPYLGRYISGGIIKYRNSAHRIKKVEELKDNGILTDEQFRKIKKYLDI